MATTINYREPLAPFGSSRHWRDRLGCQRSVDKIANGPHAIGNAKGFRWRHLKSLMDAAKIVMRDIERNRRDVVIQLF